MKKYTPDKLLVLATLFEKRAEIGQEVPERLKHRFEDTFSINASNEQWHNWLEANKTVLGDLIHKRWNDDYPNIYSIVGYDADNNATYAYITKSQTPPSRDFEIGKFAVLTATPPFPVLWLQIGKTAYGRSYAVPAELGHYVWLADALEKILGIARPEEVAKFVSNNKSKIDRIRRSFATQNPKYLGGGADGAAFDIGEGKVLKIFRDNVSYQKALLAFDRLHKSPSLAKTEAMIYDVGTLGKFGGHPDEPNSGYDVYYYIIETMKPVNSFYSGSYNIPLRRVLEAIAGKLDHIKGSKLRALKKVIADPSKADLIRKVVKEESKRIAEELKEEDFLEPDISATKRAIPVLKDNWLELYVEEVIMKYLTGRTDLHMGNIGVTHYGELRYFDPAYGGHESEINT